MASLGLAVTLLMACGGGGGSSPATPAPPPTAPVATPLPSTLSIQVPSGGLEVGTAVTLGHSASGLAGLSSSWNFGDGKSSTEASPQHRFEKGGHYEVVLTVRNSAGESREARARLTVNRTAHVKGLACSGAADAGWCWQHPTPSGNEMKRVWVPGTQTELRVGEFGQLFMSTDLGKTWERRATGTTEALSDIVFADARIGWVVGDKGVLLRTVDGGVSWSLVKRPAVRSLNPPRFQFATAKVLIVRAEDSSWQLSLDGGLNFLVPPYEPIAVGPDGAIWTLGAGALQRSFDGRNWQAVLDLSGAGTVRQSSLQWVEGGHLYLATIDSDGYYPPQGGVAKHFLAHSSDGGTTWRKWSPTGLATADLIRVKLRSADGLVLVAGTSQGALRSSDGGASWTQVLPPSDSNASSVVAGHGLLAASGPKVVYTSADHGLTWTTLNPPSPVGPDGLRLYVLEDRSVILGEDLTHQIYSEDLGRSWSRFPLSAFAGSRFAVHSVSFGSIDLGLATDGLGQLLRSRDGGRSWTPLASKFKEPTLLQMTTPNQAWLLDGEGRLHRSADGGMTWALDPVLKSSIQQFRFETEKLGWAITGNAPMRQAFVTQDGGLSWSPTKLPADATSMALSSRSWVAVGSDGQVMRSGDQGASWTSNTVSPGRPLRGVKFIDDQRLMALGNADEVLTSEDAGQTWRVSKLERNTSPQQVTSNLGVWPDFPDMADFAFADPLNGWIVGRGGFVLATQDGGTTWSRQAAHTRDDLTRVQFLDSRTGWISGLSRSGWLIMSSNSLLSTGTGGQ